MSLSQLVKRLQRRGQIVQMTHPAPAPAPAPAPVPEQVQDQPQPVTPLEPAEPLAVPVADPESWRVLDAAYLAHHVNCNTCQAAGRGANYALRCGVGASLWRDYESAAMQPTGTRQRGFAGRP